MKGCLLGRELQMAKKTLIYVLMFSKLAYGTQNNFVCLTRSVYLSLSVHLFTNGVVRIGKLGWVLESTGKTGRADYSAQLLDLTWY